MDGCANDVRDHVEDAEGLLCLWRCFGPFRVQKTATAAHPPRSFHCFESAIGTNDLSINRWTAARTTRETVYRLYNDLALVRIPRSSTERLAACTVARVPETVLTASEGQYLTTSLSAK